MERASISIPDTPLEAEGGADAGTKEGQAAACPSFAHCAHAFFGMMRPISPPARKYTTRTSPVSASWKI